VRGSGNVFRDLGHVSPDVEQLKAVLAAEIIKMLDRQGISVRAAHAQTGIAPRTSPASATPTWAASPWTGCSPSSTASDRG